MGGWEPKDRIKIVGQDPDLPVTSSSDGLKERLDVSASVIGSLVPKDYDYMALTYVAAGNGVGKVETVTYKTGGSGGTTTAVLTLAYNSDHKVSSVTRT
jgi:hypothetical protein